MVFDVSELMQGLSQRVAQVLADDTFVLGLGEHDTVFARYMDDLLDYANDNLTDSQVAELNELGYTVEDFVSDTMAGLVDQTFPNLKASQDKIVEVIHSGLRDDDPNFDILQRDYDGDVAGYINDYVSIYDIEEATVSLISDFTIETGVEHNIDIGAFIDSVR